MVSLSFNKLIYLFTISLLTLNVFAVDYSEFGDSGTLPDSPLHFFDTMYENYQLATADSDQEKAELLLAHMEERYAEIGVMLEQQNYEGVYDASLDAQEHAEELHEVLETIQTTTTYSDIDFVH